MLLRPKEWLQANTRILAAPLLLAASGDSADANEKCAPLKRARTCAAANGVRWSKSCRR